MQLAIFLLSEIIQPDSSSILFMFVFLLICKLETSLKHSHTYFKCLSVFQFLLY